MNVYIEDHIIKLSYIVPRNMMGSLVGIMSNSSSSMIYVTVQTNTENDRASEK